MVVSRSAYFGTGVSVVIVFADEPVWVPQLRLRPDLSFLGPLRPYSQLFTDGKSTYQEFRIAGVCEEHKARHKKKS